MSKLCSSLHIMARTSPSANPQTSSSGGSDTEAMDSEGAPTPPRGGRGRGRGGAAAASRQRAASASHIPTVQPQLGAPGAPPGLPSFFGLPFLTAWRARSASSPVLQQMGMDGGGGPERQHQQPLVAADLPPGLPFPINVASGHAAPPHLHPRHAGALPVATAGGPPMGRNGPFAGGPGDPKLPPLHGSGGPVGSAGGATASDLFPPAVVENAFGNFMASLSDAVSDGSAPPSAAAHDLMASAAAAAAADAATEGGGAGGSAAPSLPLMDSALLMQVPSSALPPDMQVSEGRGVFGRLFSRNSTLKMVHSLFDRWAAQEGGGGAGAAGPGEGATGGPGPSDGSAGPYALQHHNHQHHPQQQAYHPHDPRRGPAPYGGMQHQGPGGYGPLPPPGAPWGPPQQQHPEAVGYITYAPGPGGYPPAGPRPPHAAAATGAVLGKRGREESNGSATTSSAAAGGPGRKLQRGLSGVFKPLLSIVSFGRRNRDAANAAAAAAVAAGSGAPAADGAGAAGAGTSGADGAPSVGLGALGLPSLLDGPGGLLSAIDSKLFDGLPSLVGVDGVDAEALTALAATLDAPQEGSDGGGGAGGSGVQVKTEPRVSGDNGVGPGPEDGRAQQEAEAEAEAQAIRLPEQAVGVSAESHLPTPFVVPEMQERVAPGQQHHQPSSFTHSGGGTMAATVGPATGSPQGWGPVDASGGPGSSQAHTVTTGAGGSGYANSPHDYQQQHMQQRHQQHQQQHQYQQHYGAPPPHFYAPPPPRMGGSGAEASGSGAGPSGWGGAPPTALQPHAYHHHQQQPPYPHQPPYLQPPQHQYPYQLQQFPGQQGQQGQQQPGQQQPEGGMGGSLLMKLSSTMSDVFKSLSWR